jgi:hypothetical protein
VKTFIGYGYNARDKWIEEAIFPIVKAFDDEVLHGKNMPGQQLADGVKDQIRKADNLIGFNTRRVDSATSELGQTSHTWVLQELRVTPSAVAEPPPAVVTARGHRVLRVRDEWLETYRIS